jgi:CRISPR-associated protein Csd2
MKFHGPYLENTMTKTKEVLARRYDFVLLFDVLDGNPNGDPDNGNIPRMDDETNQGIVTDGCLKRKIRNAIAAAQQDQEGKVLAGYDLYFQTQDAVFEKRVLNLVHQSAWDTLGLKPAADAPEDPKEGDASKGKKRKAKTGDRGEFDNVRKARDWMCANFYDIRAFGAVMTTGVNCGQVRGPVQITYARSIDPITPMDVSITRKSVTTEKEASDQINKLDDETKKRFGAITGTMGRKNTVPYALYRCHGFVNPFLAKDTGFTDADLNLLWDALKGVMWEIDRSAARGLMCTRGLYVFEHDSKLGKAPAHELFDRIKVPSLGPDRAPRAFTEYAVEVDDKDLPQGVTLRRLVG